MNAGAPLSRGPATFRISTSFAASHARTRASAAGSAASGGTTRHGRSSSRAQRSVYAVPPPSGSREDQRRVGVADVPQRAARIARGARLAQRVALGDRAVLGEASLRAPAAARNAELEGDVERRAVDAGLPARHDLPDDPRPARRAARRAVDAPLVAQRSVDRITVADAARCRPGRGRWRSSRPPPGADRTRRAAAAPLRSCVNMPYMPLWVYESPPPLVFIGNAPPGAVRPPDDEGPALAGLAEARGLEAPSSGRW